MDLKNLNEQLNNARNALGQIQNQTRIFEGVIQSVLENAPESEKKEAERVQLMIKKALNSAKNGKGDEAQQIIKDFQNGR